MCLHELRNGQLVSGSGDKTIKLWNTSTGECLSTLIGHSSYVQCLDSTENDHLISSSFDRTLKLWNTLTGECLRTIVVGNDEEENFRENFILDLKYFKDGIFFTGSHDGKLKFWNTNKGVCTKAVDAHEEMIDDIILV
jgi:WD40 repeat protein